MTTSYTGYSLNVYYDFDPEDGEGMVGRITDDGTTITAVPGLTTFVRTTGGDPRVAGFVDGSDLRLAAAIRPSTSPRIFDATSGSTTPVATPSWPKVANLYDIQELGGFFYVLDYDNARVVELDSSYAETLAVFDFAGDATTGALLAPGDSAYGQAILNIGGVLYGLFSITNSSWTTYQNSVLVKFTISNYTSIDVGSTDYNNGINKNAFAMAVSGSDLYIACIGGAQANGAPNTNSSLDKIAYGASPLNGATVTQPVTYATSGIGYEIRDISFNGSTAYLLIGSYNGSWVMEGKLIQTTTSWSSFGVVINNFTGGVGGNLFAAQYVPDNNRILLALGNDILYYNAASPLAPVATLTLTSDLQSGSTYTALNDLSYVGAQTTLPRRVAGYRSPTQVSLSPRGIAARALAKGRPELLPEELDELEALLSEQ
ncbi:MAG: hypothetical protein QM676_09790 [Novosphingobium sp.]